MNINNVYGWSCNDEKDKTFLILELMDGSLSDLLWGDKKKSLNDNEKIKILLDIANGISYLHRNNILHRDLKSLNVLYKYENDYIAKLCDLGLAIKKPESDISKNVLSDKFIGSLLWLPNECLKRVNNNNFSKMSDIYSFGIVMYEVIDQKMPFSNNKEIYGIDLEDEDYGIPDFCELIKNGLTPTIEKSLTCKEGVLKEIMLKCLEVNPNDRIQFDDIIQLLENLL
jgi:eukaryotic-like serine/threonine-protein kinase